MVELDGQSSLGQYLGFFRTQHPHVSTHSTPLHHNSYSNLLASVHVVGMGGDEAAPPIANPALEQFFRLASFRIEKILEGIDDKWSEIHQRDLQSTVSA